MQMLNRTNAAAHRPSQDKILLFGGGNFIRAFAAWMIDLLNEKTDFNGGIVVIKPTPGPAYEDLLAQDGLYHVILNGIQDGQLLQDIRLIQAVTSSIHPYQAWEDYLALAENPTIRYLISNTTEAGIIYDPSNQVTDAPPQSFPGKLTLWLYHRFLHFKGDPKKGCIFLPCELSANNGDDLRHCILQYADQWQLSADFKDWLRAHSVFCNTLVDRIVTGFPEDRKAELSQKTGFEDKLMVVGEPYHSWVIQGPASLAKELPFHEIGLAVKWVDDLRPYREQKVKILNGAHTAMVPVGHLAGKVSVKETIEDPLIGRFIEKLLQEEVWPTLDFPETELADFTRKTMDRFRNPFIFHKLMDIALNSVSKFKTRLLPTLLEYHEHKGYCPPRITFALAALIVFYQGEWNGKSIALRDDASVLAFFKTAWARNEDDLNQLSRLVLGNTSFWGQDLNEVAGLTALTSQYIQDIREKGIDHSISLL
ncbi:MAG: tagaturonate reductase [Saprospiraceae bacterium]